MAKNALPFWESKTPEEMTEEEWERLCDRCGLCCLHKIEDSDTHEVYYTYVACRLLDIESCTCLSYTNRFDLIPNCLKIERREFARIHLLPKTCAYRKVSQGEKLDWWHPLISKNAKTVHQSGVSVRNKAIPEKNIHPDEIETCFFFKIQ
jgi:uncharacterized cysteine cluster protein YcgN (CxxCxxCC family)